MQGITASSITRLSAAPRSRPNRALEFKRFLAVPPPRGMLPPPSTLHFDRGFTRHASAPGVRIMSPRYVQPLENRRLLSTYNYDYFDYSGVIDYGDYGVIDNTIQNSSPSRITDFSGSARRDEIIVSAST